MPTPTAAAASSAPATSTTELLTPWGGASALQRPTHRRCHGASCSPLDAPPSCLPVSARCGAAADAVGSCTSAAAAAYDAPAPPAESIARLSAERVRGLRIFFLDGHVGPMNDMLAFLHEALGVNTSNVEGMVMMQGLVNRQQIDARFFKCRLCRLGLNTSRQVANWLTMSNTGRAFTLPNCELKRCRLAIHDDATRRSFASLFGASFEKHYDVVACNFPSWQCALFMHVNVSIVMRFTHRYDHHAQGISLGSGAVRLNANATSGAQEMGTVLRTMARMPNVIVAASNAYDHIYLKRNLGIDALPWPGLSVQLRTIRYTGGSARARPEVLFCCGAQPYNKPIDQWAQLIANASKRAPPIDAAAPPRRFAWLNDLYRKSFQCKRFKLLPPPPPSHPSAPPPPAPTAAAGDLGAAVSAGRRLRSTRAGKKPSKPQKAKVETREQCGYRYEDVASHPLVLLLPYSVHSYGLVNAYSMGIPVVAPSLRLLSELHAASGIVSHKGPGNVPWRSTPERPIRTWLMCARTKRRTSPLLSLSSLAASTPAHASRG